eukprot:TRINITY_DN2853_c0_g2_i1.p1 TRINITY_DN2853_c0_g2~~TRINITY_DN2853_c0_g2_i1.p1  ORF type:complete len:424 (+),score=93.30 TRINITY_DN2853_c0_g2_i1:57-1328(+)
MSKSGLGSLLRGVKSAKFKRRDPDLVKLACQEWIYNAEGTLEPRGNVGMPNDVHVPFVFHARKIPPIPASAAVSWVHDRVVTEHALLHALVIPGLRWYHKVHGNYNVPHDYVIQSPTAPPLLRTIQLGKAIERCRGIKRTPGTEAGALRRRFMSRTRDKGRMLLFLQGMQWHLDKYGTLSEVPDVYILPDDSPSPGSDLSELLEDAREGRVMWGLFEWMRSNGFRAKPHALQRAALSNLTPGQVVFAAEYERTGGVIPETPRRPCIGTPLALQRYPGRVLTVSILEDEFFSKEKAYLHVVGSWHPEKGITNAALAKFVGTSRGMKLTVAQQAKAAELTIAEAAIVLEMLNAERQQAQIEYQQAGELVAWTRAAGPKVRPPGSLDRAEVLAWRAASNIRLSERDFDNFTQWYKAALPAALATMA